ncbi:hypothetical protein MYU51_018703 [Penicillium brevicompactum]
MDAPNSSSDQEIEGDQQHSELPILREQETPQETSDHVPPMVGEMITLQIFLLGHTLATEPFQPILKVLAVLERDDPQFTFPAARLVGLYRRLWESCASKHRWRETRARQPRLGGCWYAPEKTEARSSASPRQAAIPAAHF